MADGVGTGWHRWRRVPEVGMVVAALLYLGGCAGSVPDPEVPAPAAGSALRAQPLDVAELRARPALGFDLRVQPVLDAAQLDPGDLRAPCGGRFALPLAGGARQVLRSTTALVVEARAPVADGGAVVDRVAAGVRPGCTPSSGPPVTVQSAALPAVGEQRVGWVERWPAPPGTAPSPVQLRFVALVAGSGQLGLLVVEAGEPFDYAEFAVLVEMAFRPR